MFPGITPMNVGDMEYTAWVGMAISADKEQARIEAENRKNAAQG